jgi:hypothetical protein
VLKAIICCRQYGSAAGLSVGTANPYYVRFASNGTSVLAYAMSQTPTFFSLWIGNMMFWVMRQLVEMEQIHLPSAGAAGVGFDATYDALVNTLISGGVKGCCEHSL